jgi:hypothetical protein
VPEVVGLKTTLLVQLAPAARGLAQFTFVLLNEVAPGPVMVVVAVKVMGVVPVLVRVMAWAAVDVPTGVEAKVREPGVIERVGPELVPVPERLTLWTVGEPLSE